MTKTMQLIAMLALILTTNVASADDDDNVVGQVPAGQIAYHFVVGLSIPPDGPPPNVTGFIAFIEGVDGPMFANDPCPTAPITTGCAENAFFTIRIRRFSAGPPLPIITADTSGVSRAALFNGFVFDVYLDRTPDQDWANADSFSNGQRIATFEESAFLNTTVTDGAAFNQFSSKLVASEAVIYHGQLVDFDVLVPNGVTSNNFGATNSPSATGSAIAIGGSDDDDDDDG